MQRFKAALTTGNWRDNPEPLVRDDSGDFVLYADAQSRIAELESQLAEREWISVEDRLPPDETPVIVLYNEIPTIAEIRWEHPTHEETFKAFKYWDDPIDDGKGWEWCDITHWMPIPPLSEKAKETVPTAFQRALKSVRKEMSVVLSAGERWKNEQEKER